MEEKEPEVEMIRIEFMCPERPEGPIILDMSEDADAE